MLLLLVSVPASADEGARPSLRERTAAVARQVVAIVGQRIVAPVQLEVVNDSAEAVIGGFTQALLEAGHPVRLSPLPDQTGTVVTVRRTTSPDGAEEGLDVRVEQWPERSILHARLWSMGSEPADGEAGGAFERLLVPVIIGTAGALIVYLFFTVRS